MLAIRRLPQLAATEARSLTTKPNSAQFALHDGKPKTSLKFVLHDGKGTLNEALTFFWKHDLNMTRIESRPSKRTNDYEFFIDFESRPTDPAVTQLVKELKTHCRQVELVESRKVAWFPRKVRDLDRVAAEVLSAGSDLEADHPGFKDQEYRTRRNHLAETALNYKHGQVIPRIDYTKEELATWAAIYAKLYPLLEEHACAEYLKQLDRFTKYCNCGPTSIPQLQDITDFLRDASGFAIRPVAGLLSSRNFLYGLAFRTFFSTQYIRHHSKPLYTPEPDICHELLGHVPLFADPDFADFSQEIGLASIGATDDQITKLARCYWFSVEFGLCQQYGKRKAYGAGLLSSFGELEYSMSKEPEIREWDPFAAGEQNYPVTTYQPVYYLATSFEEAKRRMKDFSDSFARPFNVRYNPYTQSVEVDRNVEVIDPPAKPEQKA